MKKPRDRGARAIVRRARSGAGATAGGSDARPFELGGQVIAPGARGRIEIPVAPLYNQAMISLVTFVLNGVRPGPRLWVCGAIHGDELVGIAIILELLQRLEARDLSGTLLTFPAVNVFGVLQQ